MEIMPSSGALTANTASATKLIVCIAVLTNFTPCEDKHTGSLSNLKNIGQNKAANLIDLALKSPKLEKNGPKLAHQAS